jgi:hypothetical protein
MALFPIKSLSQRCTLDSPDTDYRAAKKVEQYRVSDEALYLAAFPGSQYIPFDALDQVWSKNTALSLTGCCGKQLPMVCLRLGYDGDIFQNILFEKQSSVDQVLDRIRTRRPDVPIDRNTTTRN